jgi:hypothetical protein
MAWLNNASTIATLVLAIFGIGGYLYGIISFLRKRANPVRQDSSSSHTSRPQKSIPSRPISWLEWIELFARGFVTTADFVMNLFPTDENIEDMPEIQRVGICAMLFGFVLIIGEIILGLAIGIFLGFMGVNNPAGAAIGITTILILTTYSLMYIYHVGLLVEERQLEQYREIEKEQTVRQ